MILLESGNRILQEIVLAELRFEKEASAEEKSKKKAGIDVRLCDFDDASYHVTTEDRVIVVNMVLPCFSQIKANGGQEALQKTYGDLLAAPAAGADVTLRIKLDGAPDDIEGLARKVSQVKSVAVGGVFEKYLDGVLNGNCSGDPFTFTLRSDTKIYFFPQKDRMSVTYQLDFSDRVDLAVARVFLVELVESRRQVQAAPVVAFSENPPSEMKHFGITEKQGNLGFVTFAVMKNNVDNNKKDKVKQILQSFRNYLQYHIKCSKSFFHSRMRARVNSLLQVLNRARTDLEDKEKTTASGKTFVRK